MAKSETKNEIAKAQTSVLGVQSSDQLPEFMREDVGLGTQELSKYISPPRVKVTQSNRSSQYAQFGEGEVVLTPMGVRVALNNQPFYFIPLLFFPEYCIVNPIKMKGTLPMIRERTLDPASEIAIISRDPVRRKSVVCPENKDHVLSYVEYLTFIAIILGTDGPGVGMPVVLSFSGAEHKVGQQLAALINMRRAPIFANIFEGVVPKQKRENAQGSWYGINVMNPTSEGSPDGLVRDPEEYKLLKEKHLELKSQLEEKLIQVNYDDDVNELNDSAPSAAAKTM